MKLNLRNQTRTMSVQLVNVCVTGALTIIGFAMANLIVGPFLSSYLQVAALEAFWVSLLLSMPWAGIMAAFISAAEKRELRAWRENR